MHSADNSDEVHDTLLFTAVGALLSWGQTLNCIRPPEQQWQQTVFAKRGEWEMAPMVGKEIAFVRLHIK